MQFTSSARIPGITSPRQITWPALRAAEPDDAGSLAAFSCGAQPWQQEVEKFIQEHALARHLGTETPRLRMLVAEVGEKLVGLIAHRSGPIELLNGGTVTGAVAALVAVATEYQGAEIEAGPKLSKYL